MGRFSAEDRAAVASGRRHSRNWNQRHPLLGEGFVNKGFFLGPGWRECRNWINRVILRKPNGFQSPTDRVTPAIHLRWKAALALDALGAAAQPAVQRLLPLLTQSGSESNAKEAAFVLAGIGQISLLTNLPPVQGDWPLYCAIWAVAEHPKLATNLAPWLIFQATNMPASSYPAATWALGQIHSDPEESIPFLIQELTNTIGPVSTWHPSAAAEALGHFGPQASNAIPALNAARSNTQIREVIDEALEKIEPKTRATHKKQTSEMP